MKKLFLCGSIMLLSSAAIAQNSFHFNSTDDGTRQDIGISSGVLTFGQFINNCDKPPFLENINWERIYIGIGTPSPTEQLHTTQGVRFEGISQDNEQKKVLVQDAFGKLFWRDASTLGSGTTTGNFWNLGGNSIAAGNFLGTTNNLDLVFKRNNQFAGFLGTSNTSFGVNALNPLSPGSNNTAIGTATLSANTSGYNNTSNGYYALSLNTTGSYNTAIGKQALQFNTIGDENTALGANALGSNVSASGNTGIGVRALATNKTGIGNTAIGKSALYNNQADNNTATGATALLTNTSGLQNTANGAWALWNITTGSNNTALGYYAGAGILTGNANTIIGANVSGLPSTLSNTIIIADGDGVKRLYVDNAGHAGLATTTPTAALHVNCAGIPVTGQSNIRFENLQQGSGHVLVVDDNGYVMRAVTTNANKAASSEEIDAVKAELAELKAQMKALRAAQQNMDADINAPGNTTQKK
ncbi:hypothetical protein ACTHGU_13320 [Chitinophagaceae bacterium MMS25-I14]